MVWMRSLTVYNTPSRKAFVSTRDIEVLIAEPFLVQQESLYCCRRPAQYLEKID
jgi:hypothetical protein